LWDLGQQPVASDRLLEDWKLVAGNWRPNGGHGFVSTNLFFDSAKAVSSSGTVNRGSVGGPILLQNTRDVPQDAQDMHGLRLST